MYNNSNPMGLFWKVLMMAKIAAATLASLKFIYRCQNSARALLDWGLWALQIFLNFSLSWSKAAQKENLIYSRV